MFKTLLIALVAFPALTAASNETAAAGTRHGIAGNASYGRSAKLTFQLSCDNARSTHLTYFQNAETAQNNVQIAALPNSSDAIRGLITLPQSLSELPRDPNAMVIPQTDNMTTSSIRRPSRRGEE